MSPALPSCQAWATPVPCLPATLDSVPCCVCLTQLFYLLWAGCLQRKRGAPVAPEYCYLPSELPQVPARKPADAYTVFPSHYCSCQSFQFDVVGRGEAVCVSVRRAGAVVATASCADG